MGPRDKQDGLLTWIPEIRKEGGMEATDNHQRGLLCCRRASSKLSVAHLGTVGCLELLLLFKLFFGLRWVFAFSSCEQGLKGTQAQWLWPEGYVALQHVGLRSLTRDWTCIPCIGRQFLTIGPPGKSLWSFLGTERQIAGDSLHLLWTYCVLFTLCLILRRFVSSISILQMRKLRQITFLKLSNW